MEDLESKINALTSENTALKGEVAHLQHIIKQITKQEESPTNNNCNTSIISSHRVALRVSPSRNAQAGICLLIVLFSLGLLVNVAGHGQGNGLRVNEALPRARRDAPPVVHLMDSDKGGEKNQMVDMWEDADDFDLDEVSDHGMKRKSEDENEEDDESLLPTHHKRARIRLPVANEEEDEEHEEHEDEGPVAVALLVPPHPRHHPPEVSQVMSSFLNNNHRVLNIHVWPLSR